MLLDVIEDLKSNCSEQLLDVLGDFDSDGKILDYNLEVEARISDDDCLIVTHQGNDITEYCRDAFLEGAREIAGEVHWVTGALRQTFRDIYGVHAQ